MVTYAALTGRDQMVFIMKEKEFSNCSAGELQFVMGGVATTCEFNLGECFRKVISFIKEYHKEIIRGFKKGWNNF